jgi:hypothetical protein
MGAECNSVVRGAGWAWAAVLEFGTVWERDRARGMRSGHEARELRPDACLGPDVRTLALPIN